MSEDNIEIVRRWLETLGSTPEKAPASAAEFWDLDADYYPVRKFPEARPCHGLEEISRFLAGFAEAWSHREYELTTLTPIGDDRVLVCANLRAKGRGSGVQLEGDVYHCVWLRHGHFFRLEDHLTVSGALHALGLTGETLEAAGLRDSAANPATGAR